MLDPDAQADMKKKPNARRPKNKTQRTIPKPTPLIKTETLLTKDPLWKDSFVIDDDETGFVSEPAAKQFEADAAGYTHLIESEYNAIADVDRDYAKSVPASAHAYYHGILYWYELALFAQKNGTGSQDQERLVQFVQGYGTALIASGAGKYLEGLGDYQDATGVKHKIHAQEPNEHGHFGRITAQTHGLYETLPAPAILLQRVAEDLAASQRGAAGSDEWMLNEIAPQQHQARAPEAVNGRRQRNAQGAEDEGGVPVDPGDDSDGGAEDEAEEEDYVNSRPTVNLLGWRGSFPLNANQLNEIRNVLEDEDPRVRLVNKRYSVQRELFELVVRKLRECKRYKLSIIPATTGGSMVQQVIWKPLKSTASQHDQAITYDGCAMSRTALPPRAAIAAKVMCYRTLRREIEEDDGVVRNSWACYSFNKYTAVPANWIANRNVIIHRGYDGLINYAPFRTQETSRANTLLAYLNKFKTY